MSILVCENEERRQSYQGDEMSKVIYPDEPDPYMIKVNTIWAGIRQTYKYSDHRKNRCVIADDNLLEGL